MLPSQVLEYLISATAGCIYSTYRAGVHPTHTQTQEVISVEEEKLELYLLFLLIEMFVPPAYRIPPINIITVL